MKVFNGLWLSATLKRISNFIIISLQALFALACLLAVSFGANWAIESTFARLSHSGTTTSSPDFENMSPERMEQTLNEEILKFSREAIASSYQQMNEELLRAKLAGRRPNKKILEALNLGIETHKKTIAEVEEGRAFNVRCSSGDGCFEQGFIEAHKDSPTADILANHFYREACLRNSGKGCFAVGLGFHKEGNDRAAEAYYRRACLKLELGDACVVLADLLERQERMSEVKALRTRGCKLGVVSGCNF